MADEITAAVSLAVVKSSLTANFPLVRDTFSMSGDSVSRNVQSIPTTAAGTALVIAAGVSTVGWAYFRNTDATNYVEIGVQVAGTFYPVIKLKATEFGCCRLAVSTLYARANTAAVNLDMSIVED
jgi:hypothetical protein